METLAKHFKELCLLALCLANALVYTNLWAERESEWLRVHFLDVGQGDAVLIDSPTRRRVLVDGGKNRQVLSELSQVLPQLEKRVDVVLATHPDLDHIGGLPAVIERYQVGLLLSPLTKTAKPAEVDLARSVEKRGVETLVAKRGVVLHLGDGVKLTLLYPEGDVYALDPNDASIVARLEYGEHSFLLTGDAGLRTEMLLLSKDGPALRTSVLKAGHHGSRTSSSLPFIETVAPEYAVISAGKDNSYGHPHQVVLDNLASVGATVLSTFEEGTIKFETNGERLRVK